MAEYRFVGDRIRAAREAHDPPLSRQDLADAVERSKSMVTLWELGYREPMVEQMIAMAVTLDVPVESFFATEVPA